MATFYTRQKKTRLFACGTHPLWQKVIASSFLNKIFIEKLYNLANEDDDLLVLTHWITVEAGDNVHL